MKRIAVLTSGGDAPGMNPAIRSIVRNALYQGLEVVGIRNGYQGLIEESFQNMASHSVSNIIQKGGTILKTSRSKEFTTPEGREKALANLRKHDIDGLVVVGGNGSYAGAKVFHAETGFSVVGIPGTIDNDIWGTDYTIGYDTAINTALGAIDKIRDTADSNDRVFFVEVMGRDAGFIALDVGIGGGAEAILIPETPTDVNALVKRLKAGWLRKKGSQLIVVSEGDDAGGVFALVESVKASLPNLEPRTVVLGHIQRGGSPTARDRVLASKLGAAAVDTLIAGEGAVAIGELGGVVTTCSLAQATQLKKPVDNYLIELAMILGS